ncbi:hypothetical protein RIF29_36100 [Crotalaria pallida]|uniref:CHCH domain-containing protein n=1 Tax=Crotalaria pallida TaxID=3830 RepID=A0AAN9ED90_CROPI
MLTNSFYGFQLFKGLNTSFLIPSQNHILPIYNPLPCLILSLSKTHRRRLCPFASTMARRSSGGRSARPAPRAAPSRPAPVHQAPPPAPVQSGGGGSLLGAMGSTIAQGMAFGTGSAVAHRAVDAVMGPRTIQHEVTGSAEPAPAPTANTFGGDACSVHSKAFQDCITHYGTEISKCQFYMDMLAECRKNSGSSLSA